MLLGSLVKGIEMNRRVARIVEKTNVCKSIVAVEERTTEEKDRGCTVRLFGTNSLKKGAVWRICAMETLPPSTAVTWPRVTWRASAGHPLPHQRQRNRHCHCYVNRQRCLTTPVNMTSRNRCC
jgi:hypothetical protein